MKKRPGLVQFQKRQCTQQRCDWYLHFSKSARHAFRSSEAEQDPFPVPNFLDLQDGRELVVPNVGDAIHRREQVVVEVVYVGVEGERLKPVGHAQVLQVRPSVRS